MLTSCSDLATVIEAAQLDKEFSLLYGRDHRDTEQHRYLGLLQKLEKDKPGAGALFVNAPGRTELGGNHTDHNHGCVLAAAVDLDCVAAITPLDSPEVILISEGYSETIHVDLTNLTAQKDEEGTAQALVRGVAAAFFRKTGKRGGFYGHLHATCLPGAGLSSSAAFSVLVGGSFNFLYYQGRLSPGELAVMAREAENDFFGKPCGLMDQMASAVGRTIYIDFHDPEEPRVEPLQYSFEGTGYQLAIIDTGGSHVGLTPEYASIPREMRAAAGALGYSCGREAGIDEVIGALSEIRRQAGDRAALRLLHFLEENERVQQMAERLRQGMFAEFLSLVEASGVSSCMLLQNCATVTRSEEQGILLALVMSGRICPAAVGRVHGGGFAGTVQVYIPDKDFPDYRIAMEKIFGAGSVRPIQIGRPGVCAMNGEAMFLPGLPVVRI